jgi:hypothetical protein
MRIDLRDGQWAEFRDGITHGQDKEVKRAYIARRNDPEAAVEIATVLIRVFVKDWYVKDVDGQPIPTDAADAIDRMPDDIADILSERALDLYKSSVAPDAAYAKLIGRLALGQRIGDSEIERLPDPDLFRDAVLLSQQGSFSAADLDAMDALLLALIHKLRNVQVS